MHEMMLGAHPLGMGLYNNEVKMPVRIKSRRRYGWFVMNLEKWGQKPRYLHTTYESAKREADRLARIHPRNTFAVLRTSAFIKRVMR
jgi:hypothetical protein